MSFVHCIELEGATCVGFDEAQSAWDAFSLLGWLASGSPTSILDALQRELYHHSNPRSIQSRFVTHVERNAAKIRGAECRPVMPGNDADAQRVVIGFAQLIPSLRSTVQARLEAMDLWRGDVARVVDGLTEEAMRGLSDGFLVAMRCESEPHQVYVATARRGEAYVAVGFVTRLPEFLGGTGAARDARSGRLVPINVGESGSQFGVVPEGLVHPWVPVPVEEF